MLHVNTVKGSLAGLILPVILMFSGWGTTLIAQEELSAHEPNTLLVKFTKEAHASMDRQLAVTEALTSIQSVDALNMEHQAVHMEQYIRTDPRFAERHAAYGLDRWYRITFNEDTGSDVPVLMSVYQNNPSFEHVEPEFHYEIYGQRTSEDYSADQLREVLNFDDPRFDEQWHYENTGQTGGTPGADINLLAAWDIETGDEEIIVQVVDTGIDITHPDLENMHWVNPVPGPENGYDGDIHGWSHVTNSSDIQDTNGHGSHVAGTIAAENNNGIGVAGVAGGDGSGNGVRIMTSRVFVGAFGGSGFAEAVVYGTDNGAVIANHSWGGGSFSQALRDAILYFIENAGYDADGNPVGPVQGGLLIFAAGNSNVSTPNEPIASNPEVMAVGSTTHNDTKAWYSQWGDWVHLSAPGGETNNVNEQGVLSSTPGGNYAFFQGTSMAAPHAAGVAALIASSFKNDITADDIFERMVATVDDLSESEPNFDMGAGRINAFRALEQDDGVAPASITDVDVEDVGTTSVTLSWTAPGSSGDTGQAYNYDIRYSKNPITASNFYGAQEVESPPRPRTSGSDESITISGLSHSTGYYFAVKASDFFGNVSEISNTVNATTTGVPGIVLDPDALHAIAEVDGDTVSETLTISNDGDSELSFSFPGVAVAELLRTPGIQLNNTSNIYGDLTLDKLEEDYREGHATLLGAGGPDEFGYTWIDSEETGGPVYDWVEISDIGTELSALSGTWDGNTSVSLPFDFPYYGDEHSSARVSVNGWIHFGSFTGGGFTNREIPSTQDPTSFLAVLWDDLDMRNAGSVYTYHDEDGNRFIVQWEGVPKSGQSGSSFTFQAILHASGAIVYQYKSLSGNTAANTVGIENYGGTDGLQVAFNNSYLQDELTIRFSTAPDWISMSETSGTVAPGESKEITAFFDPTDMDEGVYVEELNLSSNAPGAPSGLPVSFQIGDGEGALTIDTENLDFGDVFVNGKESFNLQLENSGTAKIEVTSVSISPDYYSVSDETMTIAPGLSRNLVVTFNPLSTGSTPGTLVITTDEAANNTHTISLIGSGVDAPEADFSMESNVITIATDEEEEIGFSLANTGGATLDYTITLGNANLLGELNGTESRGPSAGEGLEALGLQVYSGSEVNGNAVFNRYDIAKISDAVQSREAEQSFTAFSFLPKSASAGFGINGQGDIVRMNLISGSHRIVAENAGISGTPVDITLNPADGSMYVLLRGDRGSTVDRIDSDGNLQTVFTLDRKADLIAFNRQGNLFTATTDGYVGVMTRTENNRMSSFNHKVIGHIGLNASLSSLAWDAESGQLFAGYKSDRGFGIGMINLANGSVTPVSGLVSNEHVWIAFPMNNSDKYHWITIDPTEGEVDAGGNLSGSISIAPDESVPPSEYDLALMVHTNDPLKSEINQHLRVNLQGEPAAFVQFIHNAADPFMASVDIYVNEELIVDGLGYLSATPYIWVASEAEVSVAPAGSASIAEAFYDVELELERGENYTIIASGQTNHEDPDRQFDLFILEDSMISSDDEETIAFTLFHGVLDAPSVDVALRDEDPFAVDLEYGSASAYNYFMNDVIIFDLFETGSTDFFANFEHDFAEYSGEAITLLLSGLVSGSGSTGFRMIGVLPSGDVIMPRDATGVDDGDGTNLPTTFALEQNYPNPFNPTTNIEYSLPEASNVRIDVFNIQGQRVATLVNGHQSAGVHTVQFDAERLSSGMYMYRIQAGSFTQVKKMMLVK